jgi:hypothetical protein
MNIPRERGNVFKDPCHGVCPYVESVPGHQLRKKCPLLASFGPELTRNGMSSRLICFVLCREEWTCGPKFYRCLFGRSGFVCNEIAVLLCFTGRHLLVFFVFVLRENGSPAVVGRKWIAEHHRQTCFSWSTINVMDPRSS